MRADLLALNLDALAALSNRGLVKRAAKEVESGAGPTVTEAADGSVHGELPDGTRTSVPMGGFAVASCTCGAASGCRHVVAVVLAYQALAYQVLAYQALPPPGSSPQDGTTGAERWSPGEFSDDELTSRFGARVLAAARRTHRRGYAARIRRATATDPAQVELPSCTVRFLVPHELGYANTDARPDSTAESVVLAVWTYRQADEQAPEATDLYLEVGGAGGTDTDTSPLAAASDLAAEVLLDGAVNLGDGLTTAFVAAQRDLDAAGLRWPLLAMTELAEQVRAYQERHASYTPDRLAELIAEVHARGRAAAFGGSTPRSRILGTEEAAETRLRQVRLHSLGCRIDVDNDDVVANVYLAEAGSGTVLVLRHRWPADAGEVTGASLVSRRLAGTTLGALAVGNVVTESAIRLASRTIRLAGNRVARTTVSPSAGDWDALPDTVLVRSLNGLAEQLDTLPPRVIRPRVEAESVRVVAIDEVHEIGYLPGAQRLDAVISADGTALVSTVHRSVSPGSLDCLHDALNGAYGPPRFLSGTVHKTRGGVVITPIAVVAGDRIVVPDLADGADCQGFATYASTQDGRPVDMAVGQALALVSRMAHRGVRHLDAGFPDQLRAAAETLAGTGLRRSADDLRTLAASLGPNPTAGVVTAWVNAQLRLLTTSERL